MASPENAPETELPGTEAGRAPDLTGLARPGACRTLGRMALLLMGSAVFGLVSSIAAWFAVELLDSPEARSANTVPQSTTGDPASSAAPHPRVAANEPVGKPPKPPKPPHDGNGNPPGQTTAATPGNGSPPPYTPDAPPQPASADNGITTPARSIPGVKPDHSPPSPADLRAQLRRTDSPSVSLYARVARAHGEAGRHEEAGAILHEGLEAHPASDRLLLARADVLARNDEPAAAWEMLARTGRLADPAFASRILELGVRARKWDETLVVLASAGKSLPPWDAKQWADVSRLYEKTGQYRQAVEAMKAHDPGSPEVLRLRALAEKSRDRYPQAIAHQQRYIAALDRPGASAWADLAEFYRAAGESGKAELAETQARRARTGR